MDDGIRRAKARCNTSCVTKEELQFESIDLRVQRMLFYMERKEVVDGDKRGQACEEIFQHLERRGQTCFHEREH